MSNYNFKKNLKIEDNKYKLEINIPYILNKFHYKVCGSDGFYQNGQFTSNKNIENDNILVMTLKNILIIFISIKTYNNKMEYFDFIDMSKYFSKNIKINIERKIEDEIEANIDSNIEVDSDEIDSDEDSDEDSDDDEDDKKDDKDSDKDSDEDKEDDDILKNN